MHLAILTQYYPPEVGAPQRRLSELAAHFLDRSHRVTVLTGMPNYPTGKIHAGYGGCVKNERLDGVAVIRTFIYPAQRPTFVHRLANYFSFVFSSAAVGTAHLPRSDFLLVESPPLFLGLAGYWLSRLKRTRLIFNVSDLWPESAVRLGMLRQESLAFRVSAALEKFCYRKAWLVTGQSKGILADIKERFPGLRTFHLSNGVDTHRFGPSERTDSARRLLGKDGECVALYAGLHGLAQGLDQVLAAAAALREEAGLRFVLVGEGPEKGMLQEQAVRQKLQNLRFLDPRPAQDIPSLLAAADIVLVTLKGAIPGAVPSKLYEAMASARPVILVAQGEPADIVRDNRAGIVIKPGDVAGLADALRRLCSDPELRRKLGANGRVAVEQFFDRTNIATRFIRYLEASLS